jgi:hypothetical protein
MLYQHKDSFNQILISIFFHKLILAKQKVTNEYQLICIVHHLLGFMWLKRNLLTSHCYQITLGHPFSRGEIMSFLALVL